ncbi:uncharacterized protein LOC125210817 isoform X2 [Salvia hispanica]|uniref:uncharacterized protein LOC125210817 isoform X2 n=1 Tax=Salvia hispanica TaxID=49212 RepID=UPI002009B50A|nr:uncharacterized protein LOC125210817 isoform X2 [Salvia hispanica]
MPNLPSLPPLFDIYNCIPITTRQRHCFTVVPPSWLAWSPNCQGGTTLGCPLLSDFGCNVPSPEPHPTNRFLSDSGGREGGVEENWGVFEEDFAPVNLRCPLGGPLRR